MAEPQISIIIADDFPAFRTGVRSFVHGDREIKIVGEAGDCERAIALAEQLHPDVLLLDAQMPKLTGSEALERLAALAVPVKVLVMVENMERHQVLRALHCGARGVISKTADPPAFLKAIRCIQKGELWVERDVLCEWAISNARGSEARLRLTAREREIVSEILAGSSNREIATKYTIAEHTVKRHLTNIYDKLGCSTRLELCLFAMHHHVTTSN